MSAASGLQPPPVPAAGVLLLATGDFDGDGALDVVFPGGVVLGVGNGTFKPSGIAIGGSVTQLSAADINGDGKLDVMSCGAKVKLLLQR